MLDIVPTICAKLGLRRNGELVTILNGLTLDRRRFRFVFDDDTWQKVFVICERCRRRKLKLHKLDGIYRCSDCHGLARPARCRRRSTLFSTVIRPLRILGEINERIFAKDLTPRQLRRLCDKAERLRSLIPAYALSLKSEAEKLANLPQR
jgi:hypothetical protein